MEIQTLIGGQVSSPPVDWQNNTIQATFGTDSSQPQIETDSFEYVLDSAAKILDHVKNGDIFEPLKCQQIYKDGENEYVALDGYFDVSDGFEELEPTWGSVERSNRVLVKFKQDESVTNFIDQIQGVSYGSLLAEGLITSQDYVTINTVIMKKASALEIATLIITLYLISKQIADIFAKNGENASQIAALVATIPGGTVGATILAVAQLLILIAYSIALIALLVKLITDLKELFVPPTVKNKGIKFKTLLEKSCEKFGYTLETDIDELETYHYLPSKPYSNETNILKKLIPQNVAGTVGIPSTSDYGYLINEFWDLMKSMFNTKIAVVGNTIQLRNADSDYWLKQSTFKPHETLNFKSKKYNTEDLKQTRMMTFTTDVNDEWTTENYTGTSYEIKTESTKGTLNGSIKGLDRINIPLCLPNNKYKPNSIETLMITIARFADQLTKIIGQKSNYAAQIRNSRVNVLKVSQNNYDIAKVVVLVNNQLPPNHRELLSAKYLMNKYHKGKSFVSGTGQKVIYEDVDIPFNLSDLKKTLKSGTFVLSDGRVAEFIDLNYNFSKDMANCSISVQENYTNKLKEVTYEP